MEIKKAEFVVSSAKVYQCPTADKAEFAFIGRSNVGKSSLINMLTGNSSLAKTSSTPGKTQLINHFLIKSTNNHKGEHLSTAPPKSPTGTTCWFLVDLPGYGYAKVGKSEREKFQKMIKDYLLKRENLYCVFVLIDSRLKPQKIDLEFIQFLGENSIPFEIIFTKTDKQSKKKTAENIDGFSKKMLETWEKLPKMFLSSSQEKIGKEEILQEIENIINS